MRFVEVREEFPSTEKGNRVIHYILKKSNGSSTLAVVGTEQRNIRNMTYSIAEEFSSLAGLDRNSSPLPKLKSRKEVFDWLKSFMWRPSSAPDSVISRIHKQENEACSIDEGSDSMENSPQAARGMYSQNNAVAPMSDTAWIGKFWTCHKRFRHYRSFQRNGITISLNSFVYVMSEELDRHIAYIEDLYEDKKYRKKVRVRWFHKSDELECPVPAPAPHAREIFMTPFPQVLSVECVDGGATVFNNNHFEKCLLTRPDFVTQVHLCFRQFDCDGIKPFDITTVKGYWQQQLLSIIDATLPRELSESCELASDSADANEDEVTNLVNVIKRGPRSARSSRKRICRFDNRRTEGIFTSQRETSNVSCSTPDATTGSEFETDGGHYSRFTQSLFKCGDKIELLCEDSGVRGCWFRCVIVKKSPNQVKVRYEDLESGDESENLEEWVKFSKSAHPDKLGVRVNGRLTIRPSPTNLEAHCKYEIGDAVDAWWNDGWWEGVIAGKDVCGKVRVYFPEENDFAAFEVSKLRVSRDWINGRWVAIDAKEKSITKLLADRIIEHDIKARSLPENTQSDKTCTVQSPAEKAPPNVGNLLDSQEPKSPDTVHINGIASSPQDSYGDADRDKENKSVMDAVTSNFKASRKRHHEDGSASLLPDKTARRDPMSTLTADRIKGREVQDTELLPQYKSREIKRTDAKRGPTLHEPKSINASSVNNSLFNSVTLSNLVLSR